MFGVFSRPVRRPRNVRPQVRTTLRLESLEARANPAAPVMSNLSADWGNEQVVMISGHVVDDTGAGGVVHVSGAAQGNILLGTGGQFAAALKVTGTGSVYLQAENVGHEMSPSQTIHFGEKIVPPAGQSAVIGDVTITQGSDGSWHIRGHVDNTSPIGTIVKIINGPGDTTGVSGSVDVDGSFDIIVKLNPDDQGAISIIAIDGDGNQSDPWDGTIG
jgi:hypothetical protein